MALAKSASAPGLARASSSGALRSAGSAALTHAPALMEVSNLYDRMRADGLFFDRLPHVRPCGRSTTVLDDSAGKDLQSEIYFPAPATPTGERKYRRSQQPGEIYVHSGLKDQKLPGHEFSYGHRSVKGISTEDTMKAGMLLGVAAYKNSVTECVYESSKREPLGKPYIRGHPLKMLPEGYGNNSGFREDAKQVLFPTKQPQETKEAHTQYVKTHGSYAPCEAIHRDYNWPGAITDNPYFRFGIKQCAPGNEGVGARMAIDGDVDDDGNFKKSIMVQSVNEDYRHVQHPKFSHTKHQKQGPLGPPFPSDHRYGVKGSSEGGTAKACIRGFYSLPEQFPDQDLGRCLKMGRRNVTMEARAFGVPSVRSDIPQPHLRSIANSTNYGDEVGTCALLNPQRFSSLGVADQDFLLRRPKDELRGLVEIACGAEAEACFDEVFQKARDLFQDSIDLVSLDAFLYVYSENINESVRQRLQ